MLLQPAEAVARARLNPKFIVTVGDVSTALMLDSHVKPRVAIVDFKTCRGPLEPAILGSISRFEATVFKATNPAGTISQAGSDAVADALANAKKGHSLITIDGEEDLLFLEALLNAPEGALLFYGQPGNGVVMVEATQKKKESAAKLLAEGFTDK